MDRAFIVYKVVAGEDEKRLPGWYFTDDKEHPYGPFDTEENATTKCEGLKEYQANQNAV